MAAISSLGVQLLFASVVLGGHLHRAGMHAGRYRGQTVSRSRVRTHRSPTPVWRRHLGPRMACMQSRSMETRMPSQPVAGACMLASARLCAHVPRQAARCRPTEGGRGMPSRPLLPALACFRKWLTGERPYVTRTAAAYPCLCPACRPTLRQLCEADVHAGRIRPSAGTRAVCPWCGHVAIARVSFGERA